MLRELASFFSFSSSSAESKLGLALALAAAPSPSSPTSSRFPVVAIAQLCVGSIDIPMPSGVSCVPVSVCAVLAQFVGAFLNFCSTAASNLPPFADEKIAPNFCVENFMSHTKKLVGLTNAGKINGVKKSKRVT